MKTQILLSLIFTLGLGTVCRAQNTKLEEKKGTANGASAAQAALNEMLRAYETGNTAILRKNFDQSMIGLQQMLDGIAVEASRCKQMRVDLHDTKTSVGPDLAVIQTDWEKRCLMMPDLRPTLNSGQSTFLMHRGLGGWKTTGISGANPFATTNLPATMTASTTTTCSALGFISTPISMAFQIAIQDPSRLKDSSVSVRLTSGTDVETFSVPVVGGQPGVFQLSMLTIGKGSGTSGNGAIEVVVGASLCANVLVHYSTNSVTSGVQTLSSTVRFP